jgi:tRNA dimethylallyltransferase
VAVTGPTASGKTPLALALAEQLDTEIISADSMQFYRGMGIGTAAPTPDELARVKHHFVGFLDPSEDFSAGAFQTLAREVVQSLNERGRVAVVVGGSGLYVSALIDGLFEGPGKDESVRKRLQEEAEEVGVPGLFARLKEVDPDYARVINRGDLRRIVRALEVFELTGQPLSALHREHREASTPLRAVQVALEFPRAELYARINARVDRMLQKGLIEEVSRLIDRGYVEHIERLRSLGYREILSYARGEQTVEDASQAIKMNTRRYAKRQITWFRGDPRVQWLSASGKTVEALVQEILTLIRQ